MIDYVGEMRVNVRDLTQKTKIKDASDVCVEFSELKNKKQEHFAVVYLDGGNNIIESRVVSIGTLNQSLVHPREVFAPAIELRSASIIVCHNHPSGTLEPSTADLQITKRLKEAGKLLGIELLDHVIITQEGYYSMNNENDL
jgi:DNA repair protein RadC